MTKQVLDVQQMQHLQKLGLELKETTLIYAGGGGKYGLFLTRQIDKILWKSTYPAYTLQDVLDALPIQIEIPLHPECGKYELRIKRMVFNTGKVMHAVVYEKSDYINWFVLQSHEKLIDAAYELLVWCIENKFVETNKNE